MTCIKDQVLKTVYVLLMTHKLGRLTASSHCLAMSSKCKMTVTVLHFALNAKCILRKKYKFIIIHIKFIIIHVNNNDQVLLINK